MSKHDKLIHRFLQQPKDFTWVELNRLLRYFGYTPDNKGKSSGSRVRFIHAEAPPIDLHKPHPGNILKRYQLRYLHDFYNAKAFSRRLEMNLMNYKGYLGSIEFDQEDLLFYGKLEHIRALVTYEANDARGLLQAFQQAVNDYLTLCAEQGVAPETPCKGAFRVRTGPELQRQAMIAAQRAGMSFNAFIAEAVKKAVAEKMNYAESASNPPG